MTTTHPCWICTQCAVEYAAAPDGGAPPQCPICTDERQYLPADGVQRWTTLAALIEAGHRVEVAETEPGLWALTGRPGNGIGQTAHLIRTDAGNLLFDVPACIDPAAVERVRELGGIAAIVASHPHMYGQQLQWSAAFDDAPVYVAERDAHWLGRTGPAIRTWAGDVEVLPGITLTQPGGHFPGSTVAFWQGGADGRGVLLAGDTVMPVPARGWVSFMRSYPNRIPLSAAVVRRVADHVARFDADRLYNNFGERVEHDARAVILRSAQRHIAHVRGDHDADT